MGCVDIAVTAPEAVPEASARRPRVTLWLLRGTVTAHLIAVVCQPVLAGLFLTGDVAAIEMHATVADVVGFLTLGTIAVAIGYVTGGRGRIWVLPVAVVLFLAEGLQIFLGYARMLQFHIPLGVTIVVAAVLLAIWAWLPSAARARGGRA